MTGAAIQLNSVLILTAILAFVASFAVSIGPVMWVLFSELFPNRLRGKAISFAGLINSSIAFLVTFYFRGNWKLWGLQHIPDLWAICRVRRSIRYSIDAGNQGQVA